MMDKEFKDYVMQSGLILGLVYGIIMFVTYFIGVEAMLNGWVIGLSIILAIGAPIYFAVRWKNANEGILEFKMAFMLIFAIYALSALISTLFGYVLNTVIDPELPEAILNETLKFTVNLLEKLGSPEEAIDQAIEDIRAESGTYGIGAVMAQLGQSLIMGAIIALIGGAIIKKKPDVFEQE